MAETLRVQYDQIFAALYDTLDAEWSVDTVDICYLGLDSLVDPTVAGALTVPLLRDIAQLLCRNPAARERRTLLIFDEFSALPVDIATDLAERVRSYNVEVVLGVQSYAGLGRNAPRLVEAANSWVLHRTSIPEPFVAHLASSVAARCERANVVRQLECGQAMWRRFGVSTVVTIALWRDRAKVIAERSDAQDEAVGARIEQAKEQRPDLESVRELLRKSRSMRAEAAPRGKASE